MIPGSEEVSSGSLATAEPSGLSNDLLVIQEKVVSRLKLVLEAAGGDPKVQGRRIWSMKRCE